MDNKNLSVVPLYKKRELAIRAQDTLNVLMSRWENNRFGAVKLDKKGKKST